MNVTSVSRQDGRYTCLEVTANLLRQLGLRLLRGHDDHGSVRVLDVQLLQLVLDLVWLQILERLELGAKVRSCRGTGLGQGVVGVQLVPSQWSHLTSLISLQINNNNIWSFFYLCFSK